MSSDELIWREVLAVERDDGRDMFDRMFEMILDQWYCSGNRPVGTENVLFLGLTDEYDRWFALAWQGVGMTRFRLDGPFRPLKPQILELLTRHLEQLGIGVARVFCAW